MLRRDREKGKNSVENGKKMDISSHTSALNRLNIYK